MSTFYGGPQLSSTTSIQTGAAPVSYTVPAGFFAIAKWSVSHSVSLSALGVYVRVNSIVVDGFEATTANALKISIKGELTLSSGAVLLIDRESANVSISGFASFELYKNP